MATTTIATSAAGTNILINTVGDGISPVSAGGTGQTTYTNGQLLIGNTTGNTLTKATLTGGTGITVTNGTGTISLAADNNGTVTSVAAGSGLDFTTITSSGSATLGTPGTLTSATTNAVTTTSHTHNITTGIADTNIVAVDQTTTAADNDYAKFTASGIEGRSYTEVKQDLDLEIGTDVLAQQTIGIANDNLVETDSTSIANGEYAKFTASGLESKSYAEVKTDLSLNNVENTAISTATTIGTIGTGVWEGTDVGIAHGGTGQSTKIAAFDALSPTATKGDILVDDGTNVIALAVGADDLVLTADDSQPSGLKWGAAGGGGTAILRAFKAADETVNNSDTYQDDDHLVVTVTATTNYIVEVVLGVRNASATPSFKLQFTVPSITNYSGTGIYNTIDDVSYSNVVQSTLTTSPGAIITGGTCSTGAGYTAHVYLSGVLEVAGTGGAFQIQWAQQTAHASDTIVKRGSYIKLTEI